MNRGTFLSQWRFFLVVNLLMIGLSAQAADSALPAIISLLVNDDVCNKLSKKFSITWQAPVQREDSSSLTLGEIKSYNIRYKEVSASQYSSVNVTNSGMSNAMKDLTICADSGNYQLSINTVDTFGVAGAYSNNVYFDLTN